MKYPHVARAKQYAREVVSGRRVAGEYTRLACKRFLDDLKRKDIEFRPEEAERRCRFLEKLPHVKGVWAQRKELIRLEPWQSWLICNIFGFYRKDGTRRFNEAYVRVARKNGKSIIGAGIGLSMFVQDGEFGAEVYSGATSEKQAWMVFGPARMMCARDEELRQHFGIEVNAKNLNVPHDGSKFEPVIGKPGDGASPHCAIVDEFHEHKTWDQYGTFKTGMGARENPLLLIITTAGVDLASPCYEKDDEAKKILKGVLKADDFFAVIYAADDDDDWTSVTAMKKANPNLGVSVSRKFLESQLEAAKRTPAAQADYKTKHLNLWVSSGAALLNMLRWQECVDPALRIEDMVGKRCVFGLDLASSVDFAALCRLFVEEIDGNLHYYPFWRFWLPEARIEDDPTGNYRAWRDAGFIEVFDEDEIDFAKLKDAILEDALKYEPFEVVYDPWKAAGIEQSLSAEGVVMVRLAQTRNNFTAPINELEAAHLSGRIHLAPNPVANWMASNLVAKTFDDGTRKPVKEIPQNKNDGMVALLLAMNRALVSDVGPSIYETRGLISA